MERKYIIAIDFDGVIAKDMFPEIGEPRWLVQRVMKHLHKSCEIIIWTCREGRNLDSAKSWLKEHQIPYDYINENSKNNIAIYGSDTRKVFADIYVDDRSLCGFLGWLLTLIIIKWKLMWI